MSGGALDAMIESVAAVYGFSPAEIDALDLDELFWWTKKAVARRARER